MLGLIIFMILIILYAFWFGSRKIDTIENEIKETKKNRVKHK